MSDVNIGENIRKYRILKDLSQDKLGQMIGVTSQAISSWENNRTEPNIGTVELLALALGCKKSDLLGMTNSVPTYTPDIQELISLYSKLSDEQKQSILNTMKLFLRLNENH